MSHFLTDNALCVAADERAKIYARTDVTDADLARADTEYLNAVDRIYGTRVLVEPEPVTADEVADLLREEGYYFDRNAISEAVLRHFHITRRADA